MLSLEATPTPHQTSEQSACKPNTLDCATTRASTAGDDAMATAWQVLRSYHLPGRDKRSRQRYPVFPASTPNLDQKLDLLAVTIVQGQRSPAQKKTDQGEKTPKTDRFALNTASAFSAFSLPLPVFVFILLIRTRTRNLL